MAEQFSEYEQYRLQRLQASFDDENNSAHFSLKDSNLNFTDRMEVNSSRSSPYEISQSLDKELFMQKRMYSELQQKHAELLQKYRKLEEIHEQTRQELAEREVEANKLRQMLATRKETQRQTKKKLKQWVMQAKKQLNQ